MTDPANLPTEVSPPDVSALSAAPYEHGRVAPDLALGSARPEPPGIGAPLDGCPNVSTAPRKIVRCPSI